MKKLFLIPVILMFSTSLINAEEAKCETVKEKVNLNLCMARKNQKNDIHIQCPNKKIIGE